MKYLKFAAFLPAIVFLATITLLQVAALWAWDLFVAADID